MQIQISLLQDDGRTIGNFITTGFSQEDYQYLIDTLINLKNNCEKKPKENSTYSFPSEPCNYYEDALRFPEH